MKNLLILAALLLAGCAQLPQTSTVEPVKSYSLAWDTKPERKEWTKVLMNEVESKWANLSKATDMKTVCAKYDSLSTPQKKKAFGEFWVAVSTYESSWNPKSASVDVGTQSNKDTWSVGLYQMSVVDQKNYGFKFGYDYAALQTAGPNIKLAMAILEKQIIKQSKVFVTSGVYWAVIKPGGKYEKIASIKRDVLKQVPACQ